MRANKSAKALLVTLGIIGYTGCTVFTSKDHISDNSLSDSNQIDFSYKVVINNYPTEETLVFDDGKRTYFKVPNGIAISKAYLIDHSGYKEVDIKSTSYSKSDYKYSNNIGNKWVVFFHDGGQMVSTRMEMPKDISTSNSKTKEVEHKLVEQEVTKLNVQDRIGYLEEKLGGMLGLLKKYSPNNKKAQEILAQINSENENKADVQIVNNNNVNSGDVVNLSDNDTDNKPGNNLKADIALTSSENKVIRQIDQNAEHSTNIVDKFAKKITDIYYGDLNLDLLSQTFIARNRNKAEAEQNVANVNEVVLDEKLDVNIGKGHLKQDDESLFKYADSSLVIEKAKESIIEIKENIKNTLAEKLATQLGYANFYGNSYSIEVPFAYGYRKIGPKGYDVIEAMIGAINTINDHTKTNSIELIGLATSDGADQRNDWLADERAVAVKEALIKKGISPELIRTKKRDDGQYGLSVKVSVTYQQQELLSQN